MNTLHQAASCVVAAPSARASHHRQSIVAPAILGPPRGCGPRTIGAPQAAFKKEPNRNTKPNFRFWFSTFNFQRSTFYKEAP